MKQQIKQIFLWVVGLGLLITLIQHPLKQTEPAWTTWSLPLSGKTIVLDPGHGGVDGGAVGSDKTQEKEITLEISKKLQHYLQQSGALVYLTREKDEDLSSKSTKGLAQKKSEDIRKRLKIIEEKKPDLFLSIHLNALPNPSWSGAQTFFNPRRDENRHLAEAVQSEIIRNIENTDRVPLELNNVYLLKHAKVPGALVEVGFLSNNQEREQLKDEAYQQQMAGSIYNGILKYITEDPEES